MKTLPCSNDDKMKVQSFPKYEAVFEQEDNIKMKEHTNTNASVEADPAYASISPMCK